MSRGEAGERSHAPELELEPGTMKKPAFTQRATGPVVLEDHSNWEMRGWYSGKRLGSSPLRQKQWATRGEQSGAE